MNLQVQAYKGETQRCSRLDNKQHIRWWKKSKILIALSGWGSAQDRSCRGSQPVGVFWVFFTFPTARRQKESAIKPKVKFLMSTVFSQASRMCVTQTQPELWTSKEGKASAWGKCLKEHQCGLVSMNIWWLSPWVQECSTLFNVPNGVNSSSADVNVRCL